MLTAILVAVIIGIIVNVVTLVAVVLTKDVAGECQQSLIDVVKALRWEGKNL